MTSYGAFVDLGGVDGMVHCTELSWKRIKSPAEVLSIGDEGEDYGIEQVFVKSKTEDLCKLTPGGSVEKITVRRQKKDAKDSATVTVTLKNAKGETVKTKDVTLEGVAFNAAKEISLSGFEIPAEKGAVLTVTVKDANGKAIATPYTLKN